MAVVDGRRVFIVVFMARICFFFHVFPWCWTCVCDVVRCVAFGYWRCVSIQQVFRVSRTDEGTEQAANAKRKTSQQVILSFSFLSIHLPSCITL